MSHVMSKLRYFLRVYLQNCVLTCTVLVHVQYVNKSKLSFNLLLLT